ncbi:MAG: squalene--hopene cyclase [Verrucomicrobiae bacterium]|nr:squalene--hopene cyclase [Verrucomicrobiae bacterium]
MTISTSNTPTTASWPSVTSPFDRPSVTVTSPLHSFLANSRDALLSERNAEGHWEGELSTSALSTATAVVALHQVDPARHATLIAGGLRWLSENQNPDGGWGDTVKSASNISTTLLCWSALNLSEESRTTSAAHRAGDWVRDYVGSLNPDAIAETVKARYGKDRTFSVPILMLCALCGRLGENPRAAWKQVLPLPFELSVFPRSWFAAMRLPVVSYALPALIAIGHARFHQAPPLGIFRLLRRLAWPKASKLLAEIQPSSGGFLEAAPLTSFVTMALASSGEKNHPVVTRAVEFLTREVRPDGSWPIDTNLATWVTTLSVKALLTQPCQVVDLTLSDRKSIRNWLLEQQYRERHPFTDAAPGGWAWTDLPGGVPDADDTPGALLALRLLSDPESEDACREAAERGIVWLLDLQNGDGGVPTFCRGWGSLPFDRSSPDLTAHTLRAWLAWESEMPANLQERIARASGDALAYLVRQQRPDGSWVPLWFGNQHLRRDEENPTYGTAMVVKALLERRAALEPHSLAALNRGLDWLRTQQNPDGGWGGGHATPSSIEETALALDSLSGCDTVSVNALQSATDWLRKATENGTVFPAAPIGFYFAKLWYYERLYPLIWTVSALAAFEVRLKADR